MKPLRLARNEVLAAMRRQSSTVVAVEDALHRVTSEALIATQPVPPFANSAMDGFAVRSEDLSVVPARLRIVEDVPAGSVPMLPVESGQAIRIMTGAPMPEGADVVVMVEDTTSLDPGWVDIAVTAVPGTAVRPAGGDVEPGDILVDGGIRLSSRHLASIASAKGSVHVSELPVVAIMSTGDELVPPDTDDLAPGTIRDTNRVLLASMLVELGVPVMDLGIIGDDTDALRAAYTQAARAADLIVSTGGVSMGDYDYVKQVLGESGSVQFWRVAMQPGKPFAFGVVDDVPLFGLPGNPVSTFIAFEQFVRPAILHMMGAKYLLRPRIRGTMGEDVTTSREKEVFLRVLLADDRGSFVAVRSGGQGSNMLSGLAAADAFAVIPVGVDEVSAGDDVALEMFTWDENRMVSDE